jgi:hypothetical protein
MSFNFLTLGYDCSPAAALRNLNLREFALPFDWIVSGVDTLEKCFESKFLYFHKHLEFNHNKTRLIDYYGFQFPHDYPLNHITDANSVGEGIFGEENNKCIHDKWVDYYDIVLDKYNRRIERFNKIINDTNPIIVLCRYSTKDVLLLQNAFIKHFNIEPVYFVNSSNEIFENDKIININTEKNLDVWNDTAVWKQGIDDIIKKILSVK